MNQKSLKFFDDLLRKVLEESCMNKEFDITYEE